MAVKKLFRFIIPKYPYYNIYSRIKMPPRGAVSVATAVARQEVFQVEIIDENNFSGVLDHRIIQEQRPADFVGLYGGLTSTIPRLYQVASYYQGLGVPTAAGGNHINAMKEEALSSGVDIVVMGEGEHSLPEVAEALARGGDLGSIPGIAFVKDGQIIDTKRRLPIQDLDALPYPDFGLFRDIQTRIKFIPLGRTRGCNFVCEFCAVNQHLGATRACSPGYVMEEIIKSVERGCKDFFFTDDNFAQYRDSTVELCKSIVQYKKKIGQKLYFAVQVRADLARDTELLNLMRGADVETLCIGYESPIEEDLKNMKKGLNLQKLDEYTQTLKNHGFFIHGMFIFGYPTFGDSKCKLEMSIAQRAERFWDFIRRNKFDTVQVVKPVPLPGTILEKKLRSENRLYPLEMVDYSKYDGNWLCFEPDPDIDPKELMFETEKLLKRFYSYWYFVKLLCRMPIYPFEATYRFFGRFIPELLHPSEGFRGSLGAAIRKGFHAIKRDLDRRFRNARLRLGGRLILEKWRVDFQREKFFDSLEKARALIKKVKVKETSPIQC